MYQVLLLCKDNSVLAPMAFGYYHSLAGDLVEAYGAGVVAKRLDPVAVDLMQEDNIDISKYESHLLSDFKHIDFDFVLTFDKESEEESHHLPSKTVKYHYDFGDDISGSVNIADKKEVYTMVRNKLKKTIKSFIKEHFVKSA